MFKKLKYIICICLITSGIACHSEKAAQFSEQDLKLQKEVQEFLDSYTKKFVEFNTNSAEAQWKLSTRIYEDNTATEKEVEAAEEILSKFVGGSQNIATIRKFLEQKDKLQPLQTRQLESMLFAAGESPETALETIKKRIAVEGKQNKALYGFDYKIDGKSVTTNDIDGILNTENDLSKRLVAWSVSKEVGKGLKSYLAENRENLNKIVQTLGYEDYFSYQVSDYGMTRDEAMALMDKLVRELWPLYRELHTYARYELAKRYGVSEVPDMLPAHWLPNRWGQDWSAMVEVPGIDINAIIKEKGAEWIVKQGEEFYVSLGFPNLPKSFYEKSDLYPVPAGADYKKNNHASAWHLDLNQDVRSLMSIEANEEWYGTVLHEFGHIYYYLSYATPEVPVVLRGGANRAFHEAMGTLMGLAAMQKPFLQKLGLLPEEKISAEALETENTQKLLKDALQYVVFVPFAAGTMPHFEHDVYAKNLPVDEFNKRWWEYVKKYQGIVPPVERGEEFCDACSKTHINDDVAQYYDYAMSSILVFQFHEHIAKKILKQDPHATNYYGSKEVGNFLRELMAPGASVDWRILMKEKLGDDMSAKPMLDYFEPLMKYLKKQNEGRKYTLPETI